MTQAAAEVQDVAASATVVAVVATATAELVTAATTVSAVQAASAPVAVEATATQAGAAGPQGPPGGLIRVTAATTINPLSVVRIDPDDTARPASSIDLDVGAAIGVALFGALANEPLLVAAEGDIPVTGWAVGAYYLGTDGALTPDPDTGNVRIRIAYAPSPDRLIVRLGPSTRH